MSIVDARTSSVARRSRALAAAVALALAGCSRAAPPRVAQRSTTTAVSTVPARLGNGEPTAGTRLTVGADTTALVFADAVQPGERVAVDRADRAAPVMVGSIEVGAPRFAVSATGTLRRPIVLDTVVAADATHGAPIGVRHDPHTDTWQPVGSDYVDGHLTMYLPSAGTYAWARTDWNSARTIALDTMRVGIGMDTASAWLLDGLSSRLPPASVLADGSNAPELTRRRGLERATMLLATSGALGVGLRAATVDRARTWLGNPRARQGLLDGLTSTSCQNAANTLADRPDSDRAAIAGLAEAALPTCGLPAADHTIASSADPAAALLTALAARAAPPANVLTALAAAAAELIAQGRPPTTTSSTASPASTTPAVPPPSTPQQEPTLPEAPPTTPPTAPPATTATPPTSAPPTTTPAPPTTMPVPLAIKTAPSTCHTGDKDSDAKTGDGKDRLEIRGSGLTPGGPVTVVLTSPSGASTSSAHTAARNGTVVVGVDCRGRQPGRWLAVVTDTTSGRTSSVAGFNVKD